MVNNDILKKLRVALKLKDTDIIEILKLADYVITPSQLSALFRKSDNEKFIECKDQILRKFLNGLIIKYRGADFYHSYDREPPVKTAPPAWETVTKRPRHIPKNVSPSR